MLAVRSKKVKELLGYKLSDLVVERDIILPVEGDLVIERDIIHLVISTDGIVLTAEERAASWRDRYFTKVHNLVMLQYYGIYDYKTEKKSIPKIPKEAMGILATLSPRNVYPAIAVLMKDNITHLYNHDESADISLSMETLRAMAILWRVLIPISLY